MISLYKLLKSALAIALLEFSGESREYGILVAIAISSLNIFLSCINLSGSIFALKSIFQILPVTNMVVLAESIQLILSCIICSILSVCSSVRVQLSSYNTFGSIFPL
ncbi:MAG: hypothetical protein LBQ24_02625 [Candidatus Peribacteria bacterium]|nr:hypothetical protein [Candidatus Peribacteria bacterium]